MIKSLTHTVLAVASAALLTLSSLITVSATQSASPVEATFEPGRCRYDIPEGYTEGKDLECGYVVAPMWTDRDSPETVRLATIRFFATGSNPMDEPLIILNGGPGGTMEGPLSYFEPDYPFYEVLLESQDIILFDQRGIGESEPSLSCPMRSGPTHQVTADGDVVPGAMENREAIRNYQRELQTCETNLMDRNYDFSAFTSERSAGDIAAIAAAFDAEKVDLYGVSYGTRLGLFAMRDNPEIIRSVILSSIDAPVTHGFAERITGLDSALKRLFEECAADTSCNADYPDLEDSLATAVSALDDEPMEVSGDDFDGNPYTATVSAEDFMFLLYQAINSSWFLPYVPDLITSVAEGDDSALSVVAPLIVYEGGNSLDLVFETHVCQDEVPFASKQNMVDLESDPAILPEVRDYFAPIMVDSAYSSCTGLTYEASGPSANEAISSDLPVLLITGAYDPNTPLSNTEITEETLTNATSVVFANGGHGPEFTSPDCSLPILSEFLADPGSRLDTSCADDPVEFDSL